MRKAILGALIAVLVVCLVPGSLSAKSGPDEVLLSNSLKHYVKALEAYNHQANNSVVGLLRAAASNAKHVDPDLAGLLRAMSVDYQDGDDIILVAKEIAIIYNDYNDQYQWSPEPLFDPENPFEVNAPTVLLRNVK